MFTDKVSVTELSKLNFEKLLESARSGYTIVAWKVRSIRKGGRSLFYTPFKSRENPEKPIDSK